jgi:hypothetical protein
VSPADRAWIALAVYVVAYDVLAGPEQTLSEGADRYMLKHPWTTRGVAFAVAAHVCNLMPARFDVIHLLFAGLRAWKKAR